MHTQNSESGFTLVELLASTAISLVVIGAAMGAFKDGVAMNETASNIADASQNLRGGTNFLVRDLVQAGRMIPTGGISIPSGAGAGPIARPSPPGLAYTFDNVTATALPAIITGQGQGPVVDSQVTDMITMLTIDPILDKCLNSRPLNVNAFGTGGNVPVLAQDGSSFSVGTNVGCTGTTGTWIVGDGTQGQVPIRQGDLILFTNTLGTALQTVTSVDATNVYFASNGNDTFGFNQRTAAAGSITNILSVTDPITGVLTYQPVTAQRVMMYTYYVDATAVAGQPHLMRQLNNFTPQALAGIVEDLEFSYDLVDGTTNPIDKKTLPYTDASGNTFSSNQIRKVNLHVGVRSQAKSAKLGDYLRNHMTTVVSLRSLAFVDRYK